MITFLHVTYKFWFLTLTLFSKISSEHSFLSVAYCVLADFLFENANLASIRTTSSCNTTVGE